MFFRSIFIIYYKNLLSQNYRNTFLINKLICLVHKKINK